MSVRPWYKRYPSDFITGCISAKLTAEEIGAYAIVLDLLYDRGPIDFDPKWLGGMLQVSTRKCSAIIRSLISKEKLTLTDGKLRNPRVERQRLGEISEAETLSKNGRKGGEKSSKSNNGNGLAKKGLKPEGKPTRSQKLDSKPQNSKKNSSVVDPPSAVDIAAVVFSDGLRYLTDHGIAEKSARGLLGKWRKQTGDARLLQILQDAGDQKVSDPISWITAAIKQREGDSPPKVAGQVRRPKGSRAGWG